MEFSVILKNVSKSYGNMRVLRGVNLRVRKGESICIVGKNGSGKSTLLRIIAGLTDFEGVVKVNASGIGFMGQQPALYPKLSVLDNIRLFGRLLGASDGDWTRELIESLGLKAYLRVPVERLSHGTLKKADLVCALVGDPELVLLDEPLVSLDIESREAILSAYDLFHERNKTVITVTHFPEALADRCDAIYVIEDGKLERKKV